jgi:hypothetical protein
LTKASQQEDRNFGGDFQSNFSQEELFAQFAVERELKVKSATANSIPIRNGVLASKLK